MRPGTTRTSYLSSSLQRAPLCRLLTTRKVLTTCAVFPLSLHCKPLTRHNLCSETDLDSVGATLSAHKRELERARTKRLRSADASSGSSSESDSGSGSGSDSDSDEDSGSDSGAESAEDSEWHKVKMPCAECAYQSNALVWAQVRVRNTRSCTHLFVVLY
jgi:hypothetical protein